MISDELLVIKILKLLLYGYEIIKLVFEFFINGDRGVGSGRSLVIGEKTRVASVWEEGAGECSSGVGVWSGRKGGGEKVDVPGSEFWNLSGALISEL